MFWERFYNMCVQKGTKPNPVAKEIGISTGSISKWKSTNTLPNGDSLIKIANYFDCSVDYLLGRTNYFNFNLGLTPEDSAILSQFHVLPDEDKAEILTLLEMKYNKIQKEKELKIVGK